MNNIHRRDLDLRDFIKTAFNVGLCSDASQQISVNHGMVRNTTIQFDSRLNDLDRHCGQQD